MTTAEYQSLVPRETTPGATSRLFSFERVRSGTATRFYPGAGTKLHFANRDVDSLEMPGIPSGFLSAGDAVKAFYKGVCVFRGDVATIEEARGRGDDATQNVTCVGPWSKMARLVYRQYWQTGSGYQLSSRLILNQTQGGSAQSLDSELYEIAGHGASACGYTVAAADVSVSMQYLPFDECRDITVADAIRRELRFFPKAICRFDYSGETPALEIKKSTSATTASYVADIPKSRREYVYNAHPITGVDLEIEATGTVDGVEYRNIAHQTAGDTAAGNPDCLYATLQIKGASSNATRQSFKSVTEDIPSNLNDVSWWKARHPRLANVAASAITITEGARSPSNYPRISAATAGELEEAGLRCEVSTFTCKATIESTDDKEEEVYLTMNFLTTNATGTADNPKTYTWVAESSAESGESVPSGLAATILAERSGPLLSERMSIRLGDALPQLGDAIVESEGTVFLQSFDVDCAALVADLHFGVPDYLSPEDMASLLSGFRNKCTSASASIRKTGKTKDGGTNVEMGAIPPLSSTEFCPGSKAKTTIKTSGSSGSLSIQLDTTGESPKLVVTDGTKTIALDLADIPSDCGGTFSIHEIKYKDTNGDEQIYHGLFCDDIDLSDLRDGQTFSNLKYGNTTLGKIVASQDATITPLSIAAGSNISFARSGNTIVISSTGSGGTTSGYTGTDLSVAAVQYDPASHQLQVKYHHDTYENGVMTTRTTDTAWSMITGGQAVEETAGGSSS